MKFISKTAALAATLTLASTATFAEEKHFDGPYIGADIGVSDGGEFYYGANAGIRKQTENNIVFGAEATFGDYATSEDLFIGGQAATIGIDYTWSLNGYVGYVFGDTQRNLVKIGAGYNAIHAYGKSATESVGETVDDVTAFVGYERAFKGGWNLRTTVNYLKIEDADGAQFSLGVAYQF